jgi:ubiquinone/menaquinone biosynthesis C-methylase UbiE
MSWNPTEYYKDESVAEQYDGERFSSFSGRLFNGLEKRVIVRAFDDVPRSWRIADIPCGTGRLAEALLGAGFRVHGMDISSEMLSVARRRLARFGDAFTCEVADARTIGRDGPEYEAALCARVLMHFPLEHQIALLAGVARATKWRVVLSHSYSSPYQRFRRRVKRFLGHQEPARFPVTGDQIRELLGGAGLKEQRRYHLMSPISEAAYIVAAPTPVR